MERAGEPGFEPGFTVLETVRIAVNSLPRERQKSTAPSGDSVRPADEHMFVSVHHVPERVADVGALFGTGLSDYEISRQTGVSRSTVQRWRTRGTPKRYPERCRTDWRPSDPTSYCYLLGIYLGDGYVSKASSSPVLEISLDPSYPGIAAECVDAIWRVLRVRARTSIRATGGGRSIRVTAGCRRWPDAFPQHGHGKKHERAIVLTEWQRTLVDRFPRQLLRGLIHSDGSRVVNRFTVPVANGPSEYAYVRYFFTNLSADIRALFCAGCEQLGIRWTQSSYKNISVADRRSVAMLDSFVGPKH